MELTGGRTLQIVDDWLATFIPELGGDMAALTTAPDNADLTTSNRSMRDRLYSYDKLHEMFLLYVKCKGRGAETVAKALCENYFMRAYRFYKYREPQHGIFDAMAKDMFDFNQGIIDNFGENASIKICAADVEEAPRPVESPAEKEALIAQIESMKEELLIERRAGEAREQSVREEAAQSIEMLRSELKEEYEKEIAKYELDLAEKHEGLRETIKTLQEKNGEIDREVKILRGKAREDESKYAILVSEMEKALARIVSTREERDRVIEQQRAEIRRLQGELLEEQRLRSRLETEARSEVERLREELRSVAQSATERVSALQVENSAISERIRGEEERMQDFEANLAKCDREKSDLQERYNRLILMIPSAYMDKNDKNCSIV